MSKMLQSLASVFSVPASQQQLMQLGRASAPPLSALLSSVQTRGIGSGQDVKAETEKYVYSKAGTSMTDAEVYQYDPADTSSVTTANSNILDAPSAEAGSSSKKTYPPKWIKTGTKQSSKLTSTPRIPDSDPAFKTENDSKDV